MDITGNTIDVSKAIGSFEGLQIGNYGGYLGIVNRISLKQNHVVNDSNTRSGIRLSGAPGSSNIDVGSNFVSGFAQGILVESNANRSETTIAYNIPCSNILPISNGATGGTYRIWGNITATSQTACTQVNWLVDGVQGGSAETGTITTDGLYKALSTVPSTSTVTISAVTQYDSTVTDLLR